MKKFICCIFVLLVFCTSTMVLAKEFPDVDASHWAHQYISLLSDVGVINGYTDGTYNPGGNVTRAEFYKLMACTEYPEIIYEQLKISKGFTEWYEPYMFHVLDNGYMTDEIGYGNPNEPISRKEMIISLGKYVYAKRVKEGNAEAPKEIPFEDLKNVGISDYEMYCVKCAYSEGIINGYEDGSFKPDNNMTRAEVATVIYRYLMGGNR